MSSRRAWCGARRRTRIDERTAPRVAPAVEIGPAPGDRARSKVHRRWKGSSGNQPIDGRAAQPNGLDDDGQARKQAHRFGGWALFEGGGAHANARSVCLERSRVGAAVRRRFSVRNRRACPLPASIGVSGDEQGAGFELESSALAYRRRVALRRPQDSLHSSSQLPASSGVRTAPNSKRQVEKRLLGFRQHGSIVLVIKPGFGLCAVRFDLPRQLVADRP
jgi:hypothetical protein